MQKKDTKIHTSPALVLAVFLLNEVRMEHKGRSSTTLRLCYFCVFLGGVVFPFGRVPLAKAGGYVITKLLLDNRYFDCDTDYLLSDTLTLQFLTF